LIRIITEETPSLSVCIIRKGGRVVKGKNEKMEKPFD
jgi:hypothetical protein